MGGEVNGVEMGKQCGVERKGKRVEWGRKGKGRRERKKIPD